MYPADAERAYINWQNLAMNHELWDVVDRYYEYKRIVKDGILYHSPDSIEHATKMVEGYIRFHEDILESSMFHDPNVELYTIMAFHVTVLTHHSLYM